MWLNRGVRKRRSEVRTDCVEDENDCAPEERSATPLGQVGLVRRPAPEEDQTPSED
jgi:hypothetical protein